MSGWALISGESGSENAAVALQVLASLRREGRRVAGFVQHKLVDEQGQKRYEIERIGTGERVVLAVDGVAARGPTEEFFCSMAFRNDAFETARRWVEEDSPSAEILLLDGISKLEVAGKGHAATLEAALRRPGGLVVMCARASQLSGVVERFGLEESNLVAALELPVAEQDVRDFAQALEEDRRSRAAG